MAQLFNGECNISCSRIDMLKVSSYKEEPQRDLRQVAEFELSIDRLSKSKRRMQRLKGVMMSCKV
jgi:hypothetical protein